MIILLIYIQDVVLNVCYTLGIDFIAYSKDALIKKIYFNILLINYDFLNSLHLLHFTRKYECLRLLYALNDSFKFPRYSFSASL